MTFYLRIFFCLMALIGAYGVLTAQDDFEPITFEFYMIETPLSETGLDPDCMGKDEAFLHSRTKTN